MHRKLPLLFFIVFLIGLCVTVVLRLTLVRSFIDPSSGFYRGAYAAPALTLNVVTGVCAVLLLVPLAFPGKAVVLAPLRARDPLLGMLAALSALVLLADALSLFASLVTTSTSGGLFLDALFTLAAAVYFGLQAKIFLLGGEAPHAFVALLPVLWATVHLIVSWMHFTVVTSLPNNLFDLFKMVAFMLLFYYHARLVGGVPNGREGRGLLSFGLLAVWLGALSAVPLLLVRLGGGQTAAFSLPDSAVTLVLSVYILVLFVRLFFRRGPVEAATVRSAA